MSITLVAAVNNKAVLQDNLLASPCIRNPEITELLLQEGFSSASAAYNDALEKSRNDVIVFAHQDMYFPESWVFDLGRSLQWLEREDAAWGILGCFGVTANKTRYGRVYSAGLGLIGNAIERPTRVRTLDEIVLIIRQSSGLNFDVSLPGFHFYGADICLRALSRGMYNYSLPAFCVHNTQLNPTLPPDFYNCYYHFKRLWFDELPVHTSCITVSKGDLPARVLRLREAYIKHIRRTGIAPTRLPDPRAALLDG
jgi:glycosyltransferase involved in cell wall biosynthesis